MHFRKMHHHHDSSHFSFQTFLLVCDVQFSIAKERVLYVFVGAHHREEARATDDELEKLLQTYYGYVLFLMEYIFHSLIG